MCMAEQSMREMSTHYQPPDQKYSTVDIKVELTGNAHHNIILLT